MNVEIINLAQQRLEAAQAAFLKEIDQFIVQTSRDSVKTIEQNYPGHDKSMTESLNNYFNDWVTTEPTQRQNLQQNIKKTLLGLKNDIIGPQDADNPVTELEKFLAAMQKWSQQLHVALAPLEDGKVNIKSLAKRADLLREVAQHWTIYRNTWVQRWQNLIPQAPETPKTIAIGDEIVRQFYKVVQVKNLDVKIDDQLLLTAVPFMDRLYAEGFDLPMPYIVAPRWAYQQTWAWIGYAHEVGHHIYRNVEGLSEELKVNLAFTLASLGKDYATQRVWFNWLEEIFADLFGLLQVGPNFLEVQQTILPLYLSPQVLKAIGKDTDQREGLLRAADDAHPVPHLRVILALKALRLLRDKQIPKNAQDQWDELVNQLANRWTAFFNGVNPRVMNYLVFPSIKQLDRKSVIREMREVEIPLEEMDKTLDHVLDVILFTNLNALGDATMADTFTQLNTNTFIEKIKAKQSSVANAQVRAAIDKFHQEEHPELEPDLMLVEILSNNTTA